MSFSRSIPPATYAINTSVQASTKQQPFVMMFYRVTTGPIAINTRHEGEDDSRYDQINHSMSPKRFTVWTDQPEHVTKAIHGMNRSTRACHQSDSRYEQINQSMSPKRFTVWTDQPEHVTKAIHGMNRSTRACHQSDSRYEQINQSMSPKRFTVWTDQPEHVTKVIHGMNRSTRACHQSDSRYEQINQSMSPKQIQAETDVQIKLETYVWVIMGNLARYHMVFRKMSAKLLSAKLSSTK